MKIGDYKFEIIDLVFFIKKKHQPGNYYKDIFSTNAMFWAWVWSAIIIVYIVLDHFTGR